METIYPHASSTGIDKVGGTFFVQPHLEVSVRSSLVDPGRAFVAVPRHRAPTFVDVLQKLPNKEGVV